MLLMKQVQFFLNLDSTKMPTRLYAKVVGNFMALFICYYCCFVSAKYNLVESWNFLNRDLLNSILVPIWYFITDPQGAIYTRNTPNMKQFEINICHCNFLLKNIDESCS